jgi:hypothetical protein
MAFSFFITGNIFITSENQKAKYWPDWPAFCEIIRFHMDSSTPGEYFIKVRTFEYAGSSRQYANQACAG